MHTSSPLKSGKHKLLALDLDGTVLTSQHTISQELIDAIKSIAKDTHVVIVTGRHHVAAKPYYEQLGLSTPIICCNGTYIFDYQTNTVLEENAIDKQMAAEFITLSQTHDLKMVMYVRDAMLYSKSRPIEYMEALLEWSETFPPAKRPDIQKVDNFHHEATASEYVWKFVVEGEVDQFAKLPFVQDHFNGERSWIDRVDFAAKGNSKGNALTRYIEPLGIRLEECVAVGDNHNDISMLQAAGLGVAMDNADDTVKNTADLVTDKNNDDKTGLAELLSRLFK
ncbi:Pyridoxal phosphate phosphatase YbhA [Vibrio chagasii]|uniref:Cof-type HAD-IIB family hydrolase n=1 Tax=Vibrio TaxID=662 RepID=UPI000CF48C13|nr:MULTISPECIES: Cof-type HAD-IIB family hydrolase [Vibrio]MCG9673517.1 Cof-type HAD-IIB family hydrolase [Vibrio chagasii]NOI93406.1 Cof-type HAD-IIB family hydrolase [Vibrio sp. T3Y01]PQJ51472.1 HAD family hydrolase [Vibrio splendidus]CAH6845070.1 Pyridoxal phosphate phosphatase YbhA [Vibrio chagasii]CAH6846940.1 Pyridoxal phosphate phosphatase YbhA [Vibrio chagasii]